MKIKIGSWVAYTEDGLWVSPFDETRIAYDRKRDLVSDIGSACLDAREKPLVKRAGDHKYVYRIKDCDTGRFEEEYFIVQVSAENLESIQSDVDEILEDEPEEA